jgi:hypothetical protein
MDFGQLYLHWGYTAENVSSRTHPGRTHPGRFGSDFPKIPLMRLSTRLVALIPEIPLKRTATLIEPR